MMAKLIDYKLTFLLLAAFFIVNLTSLGALANNKTADAIAASSKNQHRKVYGPIAEAETAWSIARMFRPSKTVSVHQTVVAIFILNPASFSNNNIDSMIKGSMLKLPTLEDVKAVSAEEAVAILSGEMIEPTLEIVSNSALKSKPELALQADYQIKQEPVETVLNLAPPAIQQTKQTEKAPSHTPEPKATPKINIGEYIRVWIGVVSIIVMLGAGALIIFVVRSKKTVLATQDNTNQVPESKLNKVNTAVKEVEILATKEGVEQAVKLEADAVTATVTATATATVEETKSSTTQEDSLKQSLNIEDLVVKGADTHRADDIAHVATEKAQQMEKNKSLEKAVMPQATDNALDDDLNNTKIELAKAYLNIGDQQGAMVLLREVIEEGDPQQVTKAKQLIA